MKAIAYLRVSGKSQIEGDGFPRQQHAIEQATAKLGYTISKTFREEGVSGTSGWGERPAFMDMVSYALENPDTTVIFVENLTRLAREYVIQDSILVFLASKGLSLFSADTMENITEAIKEDPMKKAMIQVQAAFSELEKTNLVRKLKVARERKKAQTGRCEGQKPYGMLPGEETVLRLMLDLRAQGLTVREVTARLNDTQPTTTRNGRPWSFGSVARILARHEILQ